MKKTLLYNLLATLVTLLTSISCNEMDSIYKEFMVPGGITYATKVTPLLHAGRNRVTISWHKTDPKVTRARIWWNNKADSVSVDILPTSGDSIGTTIENLEEKTHAFIIISYDTFGNSSIPVEVLGTSYGDRYQAGLVPRPVLRCEYLNEQNTIIEWGAADVSNGAFATDIQYTNALGTTKVKRTLVSESSSVLEDYKMGTTMQIRTVFVPPLSTDTFFTPFLEQQVVAKISKTGWTATADSYINWMSASPENLIDGNPNTFWHSDVPNDTWVAAPYPHWFAVDMKTDMNIVHIELTRRQNEPGSFSQFVLQGSADGTEWTDIQQYSFDNNTNTPQKFVLPEGVVFRHLRVYAATGPASGYAFMGEISAYGY